MHNNILIVEDDLTLRTGIMYGLRDDTYNLYQASNIDEARNIYESNEINLVILDINLPDGSGLDLLKEIREKKDNVSIIILSANDMETDIVVGLEMGANDYISKPVSLMILRARVKVQLRKDGEQDIFCKGSLKLDFAKKMLFSKGNNVIELSKTEQKLLRVLVENSGITLTRSLLIDKVWTSGSEYVDENALSVSIKRLRDKLEDTPTQPNYIKKTVYGLGYTWVN